MQKLRNIKLTVEFDGTNFNGYQVQVDKRTVQGEIEKTLSSFFNEDIKISGCSRTDAGVHARNYVLNFMTKSKIEGHKILFPLNNILPDDIRVKKSEEVALDFDSRRDAKSKTYSYKFVNSNIEPAIGRQYLGQFKVPLNYEKMKEASKLFIGTHDFTAFKSLGSNAKTTIRTINSISIEKVGDIYTILVNGDGFLYNMVRIIAGTLVFVGQGTRTIEDVKDAIEVGDRLKAGKVAMAKGLTLEEIFY